MKLSELYAKSKDPSYASFFAGIAKAQHIYCDDAICQMVFDLSEDMMFSDGKDEPNFPPTSRPISQICLVEFTRYGKAWLVAVEQGNSGGVSVGLIGPASNQNVEMYPIGTFRPGSAEYFAYHDDVLRPTGYSIEEKIKLVWFCAGLMALISEPAICKRVPALSRQQRRQAERTDVPAYAAATRVVWTVLSEYEKHAPKGHSGLKMPLHYRRGHYRKAEAHFNGAVQLPNAIREEHREGWWQWIEGMWCGHPAYGIRRHDYTPRAPIGGGAAA